MTAEFKLLKFDEPEATGPYREVYLALENYANCLWHSTNTSLMYRAAKLLRLPHTKAHIEFTARARKTARYILNQNEETRAVVRRMIDGELYYPFMVRAKELEEIYDEGSKEG